MYMSDSYFDYSRYDVVTCDECESKDKQILIAQDHFYALVQMLYSDRDLNMHDLRDTLDELCHCLDISLPVGNPNIKR